MKKKGSIDALFWKEDINNKMKENKTWFLIDFLPSCKTIGCK